MNPYRGRGPSAAPSASRLPCPVVPHRGRVEADDFPCCAFQADVDLICLTLEDEEP